MTGVMVATICLVLYFRQLEQDEAAGRQFPEKTSSITTDSLKPLLMVFYK